VRAFYSVEREVEYRQRQANPRKHVTGIAVVIALHVIVVYALVTGLARKVVEVVSAPMEAKIVQGTQKQPEKVVIPPPLPKMAEPPPIAIPLPPVTLTPPPLPPPVSAPQPSTAVTTAAAMRCPDTESIYPAVSKRAEEQGTVVLRAQMGPNNKVTQVQIEKSSGHARLDNAARAAVLDCRGGSNVGQGWFSLRYTFKLR
jgi:protein TonB